MPDEPNTEAIALTAQICAFGPEAPPKAHKMELMRLLRATLPHSSGALDESLLRELDRLHVGLVRAQTSFMVVRIMHTGETMMFVTGRYDDRILLDGPDAPRFVEKTVVLDSRQIDTLLAIPL